jgi:OmcA/MtrC family decaheme c-type cytochrome
VARCNSCHIQITAVHGGLRNNPEYCVLCHNPTLFDSFDKLPRLNTGTVESFSAASKNFYHGIHMGEKLANKPFGLFERSAADSNIGPLVKIDGGMKDGYALQGDGGYAYTDSSTGKVYPVVQTLADGGYTRLGANSLQDPVAPILDYSEVRFPGNQKVCQTCHLKDTFLLPLADTNIGSNSVIVGCLDGQPNPADGGVWPVNAGSTYCLQQSVTPIVIPPAKAACGGCHNGDSARTHMDLMTRNPNTAQAVETCDVCHEKGAVVGVDVVHAAPESNPKN